MRYSHHTRNRGVLLRVNRHDRGKFTQRNEIDADLAGSDDTVKSISGWLIWPSGWFLPTTRS